jgi:hypothetical protein
MVFADKSGVIPPLSRRAAITAMAGLAMLAAGCHRVPESAREPQPAADAFFATLEGGDARGAYDGAAFGFQAGQTFDAFLANAQDLGLIGGQPPQWTSRDIGDSRAKLSGTLVNHFATPISLSVTMTKDGGAWKLFSLETATGLGEQTENRFTTVGNGSDFNDVHDQPMPSGKELDDLVHKTMAKLADAIRRDDFQGFYDSLSREWKTGRRDNGAIMGGVTPNILRSHFGGFVEKKIDLAPYIAMPPVYDEPPHIDSDGLLDATGHFDVPPNRVEFQFGYVYELPWWKLVSINVGLRKL